MSNSDRAAFKKHQQENERKKEAAAKKSRAVSEQSQNLSRFSMASYILKIAM